MTTTFFSGKPSPLRQLNPLTKLVGVLCIIVIVFAIPVWWVSALVIVVVILPAAALSGVGGRLLSLSVKLLLPLLLVLVIVQGLFFPGGTTVIAQFGPAHLSVEGLLFALGIGTRLIVLVLSSVLLLLTTHPGALMSALTEHGMSPKISYVVSSTLQIIPAFRTRADSILLAQQSRGLRLKGSPVRRVRALLPLVSPLVIGMFTDVEERSTAMEARAFGATVKRTSLSSVPDSTAERIARWVFVALAVAAIATPFVIGAL